MNEFVPHRLLFMVVTLCCVYITLSLACDPIAFRLISIQNLTVSGSVLLYPALYTLLDMLTRLIGKNKTIALIIVFHLCDLIFSYLLYWINLLPAPSTFHNLNAFTTILSPLPRMFWAGILGAIIAGTMEVLIYSFLQTKFKSFIFTSFISTSIVLLFHDVPTDIIAFKKIFPDQYLMIAVDNFIVILSILFAYTLVGSFLLKFMNQRSNV